jgi:NAD(P)-dependent dehydrogenase (short-subunit alcohol dehydrogenase family)
MGRLDGKVALISGGARGQGATEARLFVREGASVVMGDILDDEGRQVEADLRAAGGNATYIHLDVTNEDAWRSAVQTTEKLYGKLNVLVNNAGIYIRKGLEDTTEDDLDQILAVNVKGVFLGAKHAVAAMRRAGGGSIVNISSTAGLVGSPYGSPSYTASKGAVRLFTKTVALQHAKDGIRCNSIHPGPIDTEMLKEAFGPDREERTSMIPLGYVGSTDDIAYGVLYLASDESSFVTGTELVIDGGFTAQ